MRKPLSPLQAFAADADNAAQRGIDLHERLVEWLSLAQSAERLAQPGGASVAQALEHVSGELEPFRNARPTMIHDAQPAPDEPLAVAAEQFRVAAEAMEQAGCFELAFTTVSAICRLAAHASPTTALLATLHLGRIARQMNEFATAEDCYDLVVRRSTRDHDHPLAARGYIGRALLNDMRGNVPAAETNYRKALELATPNGGAFCMACQGLMTLAITREQLGEALLFGWQLYDASAESSEARVVALFELSVVALQAGFPEPAMRGFGQAIEHTSVPRLRLIFLGGAIRATAALGSVVNARHLLQDIERAVAIANQPHDAAQTLLFAAEAMHRLGERVAARHAVAASLDLARRFRYHEFEFRAEQLAERIEKAEAVEVPAGITGETVRTKRTRTDTSLQRGIQRLAALA